VVKSILGQARPARLVYLSSLSVLHASAATGAPIKEDWPLEPAPEKRGSYSQAKKEAEEIVTNAVRAHGLRAVVLRPGRVFGPDTTMLTPDVARRVGKRLVVLGNGKLKLPLIYVDDLVDAILLAARSDLFDGSVFHLVDPTEVTQNQIAQEYIRAEEPNIRIIHVPLAVVYGLALGVEVLGGLLGRRPPLSRYRVRSALAPLVFDCSAARERLGWKPRTGVVAGLDRCSGKPPLPIAAVGKELASPR
jgi:nucleoside-diphosphate-sugar epimerase